MTPPRQDEVIRLADGRLLDDVTVQQTTPRHLAANLLACAGIFAVLVHGGFLAAGTPQFRSPTSLTLLAVTLILSIWQIAVVKRGQNDASHSLHLERNTDDAKK